MRAQGPLGAAQASRLLPSRGSTVSPRGPYSCHRRERERTEIACELFEASAPGRFAKWNYERLEFLFGKVEGEELFQEVSRRKKIAKTIEYHHQG